MSKQANADSVDANTVVDINLVWSNWQNFHPTRKIGMLYFFCCLSAAKQAKMDFLTPALLYVIAKVSKDLGKVKEEAKVAEASLASVSESISMFQKEGPNRQFSLNQDVLENVEGLSNNCWRTRLRPSSQVPANWSSWVIENILKLFTPIMRRQSKSTQGEVLEMRWWITRGLPKLQLQPNVCQHLFAATPRRMGQYFCLLAEDSTEQEDLASDK